MNEIGRYLDSVYVLSHSISTVASYRTATKRFQDFLHKHYGCSDEEIIQKIERGIANVAPLLKEFVIFLDKSGYKPASITMWLGAVKGYLRHCGVKIYSEDLKGIVRIPKQTRTRDTPLTKELLVKLLHAIPLRLQCVVLAAVSSGMRIGEIVQLRLSDIDFETKPTTLNIRAETTKTKESRTTFITEEATSCLKQYLARYFGWKDGEKNINLQNTLIFYRTCSTKDLDQEPKSYLIIEGKFQRMLTDHIKKIPELYMKNENGRKVIHFHAFRKFFRTIVGDVLGRDFAEAMIGHHFYMDTYYNLPEQKKREMYLKVEQHLTVSDFQTFEKNLHDLSQKSSKIQADLEGLKQYIMNNSIKIPDSLSS